ncbi:MAG: hypothetical protein ACI8SE_000884 [Bacteroidia bacterium]|jgi:hypothetical protein
MDTRQILILVGFAVYYFIRAKAKKAKDQNEATPNRPQAKRPTAKPQRSIEEILRDLAQEDKPTPKVANVKKIRKEEIVPVIEVTENAPRRSRSKSNEHKPIEVEEIDEVFNFDLRQAIINEAILERPFQ